MSRPPFEIMVTCGPSLCKIEQFIELIRRGVSTIRVNFSHGQWQDHDVFFANLREAVKRTGKRIHINGDIQGPKLRIAKFENQAVELQEGQLFTFDKQDILGTKDRVYLPHSEFFEVCEPGDEVLINDGIVLCKAVEVSPDKIVTRVVVPGIVSDRKGIAIPSRILKMAAITEVDKVNMLNALGQVDTLMLSFVQYAKDVQEARAIVGDRCKLMAKIEKPTAVLDLDNILKYCDSVLVARGDLAVETRISRMGSLQKYILERCHKAGKRCVLATQALESLMHGNTPTHSECNDVANCVLDCFDGVLLTGEIAASHDCINTFAWCHKIVTQNGGNLIQREPVRSNDKVLNFTKDK